MSKICKSNDCNRSHDEDGDFCPICKSMGCERSMNTRTQNSNNTDNTQY